MLHVNQALYKFSLCLLEELKRFTPPMRAHGKNKFCSGSRMMTDALRNGWLCSGVWLVL